MENPIRLLVQFLILMTLQLFFFSNIVLFDRMFAFGYIAFLLILPFNFGSILGLVTAFFVGVVMDMFVDTPGVHAASCTLLMFVRPHLERVLANKIDYQDKSPSIKDMGIEWYMPYALVLTFIHHFMVFFLEVGTFRFFWATITKVVLSTMLTFIILIVYNQFAFRRKIT